MAVCRQSRYLSISPTRQLNQDNVVSVVESTLSKTGLHATQLNLEITESVILIELEAALKKLHAFRVSGICLAVDDFGAGYPSMAYLSSLAITR